MGMGIAIKANLKITRLKEKGGSSATITIGWGIGRTDI